MLNIAILSCPSCGAVTEFYDSTASQEECPECETASDTRVVN
jgi:uncharacterized protein (DUF1330 family)